MRRDRKKGKKSYRKGYAKSRRHGKIDPPLFQIHISHYKYTHTHRSGNFSFLYFEKNREMRKKEIWRKEDRRRAN